MDTKLSKQAYIKVIWVRALRCTFVLNGTGRNLLRTMRQRKMESLMKRKHIVEFSADGKTAELEMCVFCKNMHNLLAVGECSYYADGYDDNHCDGFVIVDDVSLRLY